jgi:hypothetical protein
VEPSGEVTARSNESLGSPRLATVLSGVTLLVTSANATPWRLALTVAEIVVGAVACRTIAPSLLLPAPF